MGRGSYGNVFKGKDKKTNEYRAVKIIQIITREDLNLCLKELEILRDC